MTSNGWLQIFVFFGLILAVTKPLGAYIHQVFESERPPLPGLERLFLKLCGVDGKRQQTWVEYTIAMLIFSAVTLVVTYAIERLQGVLPLNPQKLGAVEPALAFNTAASFTTNTNWQSYAGETTMSYLTQMAGLAWHNFLSAAVGIGVALALARGLTRKPGPEGAKTIGNFWVDLIRGTLYLLLPMSIGVGLILVAGGVIQNFSAYKEIVTLEGGKQLLAMGPAASQIAIKMLGTNGGGFFNANSAHPFENPTALTNLLEMWCIFAISAGLTYAYGRMARDQKQGWALFSAMSFLFFVGVTVCYWAEAHPNLAVENAYQAASEASQGFSDRAERGSQGFSDRAERGSQGFSDRAERGSQGFSDRAERGSRSVEAVPRPMRPNMEGKEVRYAIANSALFATITTDASCGAVNAMHDSFTPLGGLVPLVNIQLGEVIFGGVGAGLYGILIYVVLTVFIAGLMVGRTPEYLGKKIEAKEMKLAMFYILIFPLLILGFAAWSSVTKYGLSSLNNGGPHGLSEIIYAYTSGAGNNGSAFAGLNANTHWWNITLGLTMLMGRFLMIIPALGIAGSMLNKKTVTPGPGTFPTNGWLFVALLVAVVLIVGALTFFPALSLGPVMEHFVALHGKVY